MFLLKVMNEDDERREFNTITRCDNFTSHAGMAGGMLSVPASSMIRIEKDKEEAKGGAGHDTGGLSKP